MLATALSFAKTQTEVLAPARFGWVDLTDDLQRAVAESGLRDGCAVAFCKHTTATLAINEWEDGAQHDLRVRLQRLVPEDLYYRHDDLTCRTQNLQEDEPANGPAHVAAMLMGGASQTVPVADGEIVLGRWQRLFLIEFDTPKIRSVHFHIFGA